MEPEALTNRPLSAASSGTLPTQSAGLGLRRTLLDELLSVTTQAPDFLEVAPENWIRAGGRWREKLDAIAERYPMAAHGLSLSLGGPGKLDRSLLRETARFLDRYRITHFTEHLSYCSDHGHLYDLMPIPFTEEAVQHVAARIKQTQDLLQRRIGIEHVSYYATLGGPLSELEFVNAVLEEADCGLLLDVNNAWVNAVNHGYDPRAFIAGLPGERIMYMHIAGHYDEAEDLKIDTHGSDVTETVWGLLEHAYAVHGVKPTLLERDFNIPSLDELLREVQRIRLAQATQGSAKENTVASR